METQTLTLAAFLLARIAEDEAVALEAQPDEYEGDIPDMWVADAGEPAFIAVTSARVLADCEAKRRIVEASRDYHESDEDPDADDPDGGWALSIALRALASVYADHPDYREEWRP